MNDLAARIDQFRNMTEADPSNELGHFSLGRALLDSGNAPEAAKSFQRVIALKPDIAKVYHLLAQAQLQQNQRDYAIETLRTGIRVADRRGDLMPKNEMINALKELGIDTKEFEAAQVKKEIGEGEVLCNRCGQVKSRLPKPPFRAQIGQDIYAKICADCWQEWIKMGTKVINELRLPLSDPQAQKVFDQHMVEFLNLKS
jgi:Fe-S cluster biosynthesis and repair protein YggX